MVRGNQQCHQGSMVMPPPSLSFFQILLWSFSKNIREYCVMHVRCTAAVLCMQVEGNELALSIGRAFRLRQLDGILVCWFRSHKQLVSYFCLNDEGKPRSVIAAAPLQSTKMFSCPKCTFTRQAGFHQHTSLGLVPIQG